MEILEIRNKQGELLEAISEGKSIEEAENIIVMVHGFGTDLHERGVFDTASEKITKEFPNNSVVRFSVSGYGKSEGKQEEKSFVTMADDLKSVMTHISTRKKGHADLITLSFSMGNHYFAKAVIEENYQIKLMLIINPSEYDFKDRMQNYFRPKAKVDEKGVWHLDRADGSITKVGQPFWDALDPKLQEKNLKIIAKNYNSVLIRATDDHVVNNKIITELPFKKVIEIHGDHNYSKPEDRAVFVKKIIEVLKDE